MLIKASGPSDPPSTAYFAPRPPPDGGRTDVLGKPKAPTTDGARIQIDPAGVTIRVEGETYLVIVGAPILRMTGFESGSRSRPPSSKSHVSQISNMKSTRLRA